MFFYNWKKIYRKANKKPTEIVRIFSMMHKNKIPRNKFDPILKYQGIDFRGTSFLINPGDLWENLPTEHPRDVSIYLALASMRSWPEYRVDGVIDLDYNFCPISDLHNRMFNTDLIYIENGRLKFLYEEKASSIRRK